MHSKLVIASIFDVLLALLAPLEAEAIECVGDRTYDTAVADGCTSIAGFLDIRDNAALTNLDGLAALTSVGGSLDIYNNAALTNVDGLAALTYVGGSLSINDNAALTNIDRLTALTSVGGGLLISYNAALTNLDGLSALTYVDGTLDIYGNAALTNVNGLSALTDVGGDLNIYDNVSLCQQSVDDLLPQITVGGSIQDVSNNNGSCGSDCVGDRTYETAVAHGCTSIAGSLDIRDNAALTNLDGLAALTSVGGSLDIYNNAALTNVDGLAALTYVGGSLSINDNAALTNIDRLTALTSVGGGLLISYNAALTNLDGLSALTYVDGTLDIYGNAALTNVNGLSALTDVGGDLNIYDNVSLCQQSVDDLLPQITVGGSIQDVSNNNGSCGSGGIVANLETPVLGIDGIAADATGISNVQGWAYTTTPGAEIKRHVEVFIDGEFAMLVPCCGDRGDVEAAGGPLLAGFSGVYNWGLLESGSHELKVIITSTIGEQMVIVRELNTARFGNHKYVRKMEFTNGSGGEYTGGTLSCATVPLSAPENMSSQATVRCFNWLAEARNSSTLCEGNNPDNALYLAFDRSSQSFKTVPMPENSCFR